MRPTSQPTRVGHIVRGVQTRVAKVRRSPPPTRPIASCLRDSETVVCAIKLSSGYCGSIKMPGTGASGVAADLPWQVPRLADFAEPTEHEIGKQIGGRNGHPSPRKPARLRITERKGEIPIAGIPGASRGGVRRHVGPKQVIRRNRFHGMPCQD